MKDGAKKEISLVKIRIAGLLDYRVIPIFNFRD
jgi:hypothetical protein